MVSMKKIFEKLDRYFNANYRLAVLDMDAGGRWLVKPAPTIIAYLKAENAQGRHILIQPVLQSNYLLVDDVPRKIIRLDHQRNGGVWKPGRMVVETSPNNYQVWIHASRCLALPEKRHWLKKLKSDPGADPCNRWGRCPGFRNRKLKHRDSSGGYPLARLVWVDWRHQANIPKPKMPQLSNKASSFSPQPLEGGVCHSLNISRHNYERGDESATDFAYAIALFRRGADVHAVRDRLLIERSDWRNHTGLKRKEAYLKRVRLFCGKAKCL